MVFSSPALMPTRASSRPSSRLPEPTSWLMPLTEPPSTSSPFWVALRSITTKSPSAAARSTVLSEEKRRRWDSRSASMSSSETSSASTVTFRVAKSGSSYSGVTSVSTTNSNGLPSSIGLTSVSSGRPSAFTSFSVTALFRLACTAGSIAWA